MYLGTRGRTLAGVGTERGDGKRVPTTALGSRPVGTEPETQFAKFASQGVRGPLTFSPKCVLLVAVKS